MRYLKIYFVRSVNRNILFFQDFPVSSRLRIIICDYKNAVYVGAGWTDVEMTDVVPCRAKSEGFTEP